MKHERKGDTEKRKYNEGNREKGGTIKEVKREWLWSTEAPKPLKYYPHHQTAPFYTG